MEERLFAHAARMSEPFRALARVGRPSAGWRSTRCGSDRRSGTRRQQGNEGDLSAQTRCCGVLLGRAEENGLIARNIGETIAFCPPLIIDENQIHELFDKFGRALDETLEWVRRT